MYILALFSHKSIPSFLDGEQSCTCLMKSVKKWQRQPTAICVRSRSRLVKSVLVITITYCRAMYGVSQLKYIYICFFNKFLTHIQFFNFLFIEINFIPPPPQVTLINRVIWRTGSARRNSKSQLSFTMEGNNHTHNLKEQLNKF